MTRQAAERRLDFADVGRIHDIGDGVVIDGMPQAKAKRQNRNLVLLVVVFGQLHGSVEDGEKVGGFIALGSRFRAVALEAERIAFGAQKVIDVAAMRRMACGATLHKGGLVVRGLLAQLIDVGMAAEADAYRVGLGQARLIAGVRIVAIGAVAGGAGVRDLRVFDQLDLVVVAGDTERLRIRLGENNLAVLRGRVAHLAALGLERRMLELRHQLG
jgi:hypothetical protein